MGTIAASSATATTITRELPGRRFDHVFFPGVAWVMLITVLVGFGPTYYFAGLVRAPLPSLAIHVHAVVFSSWILLLIVQTSLVAGGRVDLHRRMGMAGAVLASLVVIVGLWAATDMLVRGGPVGRDPRAFYIVTLSNIVAFGTLFLFAFRARFNPAAHKRIMLVATTALMPAAITRWHLAIVYRKAPVAIRFSYIFLLLLMVYDLWATRRIYRATLWASAFLIALHEAVFPIGGTAIWHAFAGWVQSVAR